MAILSVCMPSNRDFASSRRAIEAALAYCEARNGRLIVSDNSRDPEKAAYWKGRSNALHYITDAPPASAENYRLALEAVETPFLLPIGDDDELHARPDVAPLDLASLGPEYIGARPRIEMFVPGLPGTRRRGYGIDAESPGERLREYAVKSDGENTTYYSLFRTEPYRALIEFFLAHHPTKGQYCDWQLAYSLIALGRLAADPSTFYRYNASSWASGETASKNARQSYLSAGLSEDYSQYYMLLQGLDVYVFVSRRNAGLAPVALAKLLAGEVSDMINAGLHVIWQTTSGAAPEIAALAQKAIAEKNPSIKFLLAASILDHFVPGLKSRYIAFLKAAISPA